MQRLGRSLFAGLQCAILGSLYGTVCALAGLAVSMYLIDHSHVWEGWILWGELPTMVVLVTPVGSICGFIAGSIAGFIGGGLGGPFGWGLGGLVGSAVVVGGLFGPVFGSSSAALQTGLAPALIGTMAAFVLGWDVRRRTPVLPGARWLAREVYGSPLGGWLGWRKQQIQ